MKIYEYKNYDEYVAEQTRANKLKLGNVWVQKGTIDQIKQRVTNPKAVICHGTRNAMEQNYFQQIAKIVQKKFKIKMTKYKSSKEDVDHALEEVRQQHSNLKTVDDGAKSGNFIMGDFQELDDSDFPIIGKKLEKQYIKLGIGAFTGATEKELIGVKPDDKRKITVDYGEGKKSRYELHVHKVEEQLLPELNDELAKTVSPDLKTLSDLKAKLKDNIQKSIDDDYEKRKHLYE